MRRRVILVATVAALLAGPSAAAQVVVPEGGDVDVNQRSGRTERTERIPGTGRTPGTERTPSTQGRTERTPGTGRTPGTARIPRPGTEEADRGPRLPATGSPVTTIALDGLTLLGAGSLLLRYRRRVVTS